MRQRFFFRAVRLLDRKAAAGLASDQMFYDYSKRGYLLPPGCKDLVDVLKLKADQALPVSKDLVGPAPASLGEIRVGRDTSVRELAALLEQKAFQIIADLMEIGIFANVNHNVDFDVITKVARKYGFIATK